MNIIDGLWEESNLKESALFRNSFNHNEETETRVSNFFGLGLTDSLGKPIKDTHDLPMMRLESEQEILKAFNTSSPLKLSKDKYQKPKIPEEVKEDHGSCFKKNRVLDDLRISKELSRISEHEKVP